MKRFAILSGAFFLLTGLTVLAEETREQKEKRLADAMAELLELMDADPTELSEGEFEKRDKRADELENVLKTLAAELAGEDEEAQEKLAIELLKKHRPDAAAKLEARRQEAQETVCKSRLKQLGTCAALYESKEKAWPDAIEALKREDLLADEKQFVCPLQGGAYVYVKPPKGGGTPSDQILFYCPAAHPSGRRAFCQFQGAVRDMREAMFPVALKAGRISEVEARVTGLAAEFFEKDGKKWVKVRGKIENLADPKLTGLPAARAIVRVSLHRRSEDETQSAGSQHRTFDAAPGAREAAFEIEMEALSPWEVKGYVHVEDRGSGLETTETLEITPSDGK